MSALEPLRINARFWQRDDLDHALDNRDIGVLFRLLRQYGGASQHRIGMATDLQQGTVSLIMNGDRAVTSIDVLNRIADGLDMPDHARMRLGLAPKERDTVKRRTALGLGVMAALSPAMVNEVLRESAAEALEFTRERAASSVGASTLQHLTAVIAELDRCYPWRPASELFPLARAYRQRVEQLLDGQRTLAEARELYVHGAYLSHILSDLAHDLGSTLTAKAYAIDSYQLAEQAGHNELCAWAADSLAATTRWDRPAEATSAALKGLRRVPRRHPLKARLHARAAQGHARQGNSEACIGLLNKATTECERLPAEMSSRFATETAERISYLVTADAAESHVRLGNWKEAERHARAAFGIARWNPARADGVRIDLGTALAHLGSPDEAVDHGNQALRSGRLGSLVPRARELDAALRSQYPKEQCTQDFHEQYQHFLNRALAS